MLCVILSFVHKMLISLYSLTVIISDLCNKYNIKYNIDHFSVKKHKPPTWSPLLSAAVSRVYWHPWVA